MASIISVPFSAFALCAAMLTAQQQLPPWAASVIAEKTFAAAYSRSDKLTPAFLVGDFNGDGCDDVAVFIVRKSTQQQGIAMLHGGTLKPIVLGAGHTLGNGGADFEWLDAWKRYAKSAHKNGAQSRANPLLRGDAIFVEKLESASALIYWDGTRYRWHQLGD